MTLSGNATSTVNLLASVRFATRLHSVTRASRQRLNRPTGLVQLGAASHRQAFDQLNMHECILPMLAWADADVQSEGAGTTAWWVAASKSGINKRMPGALMKATAILISVARAMACDR